MSLGDKIFSGALWSFFERVSTQAVQFVLGIFLARLLSPKDYGLIGLLLVFIVISQVFIDSGFTKALIQKKNRTQEDISTVFIFNLLISIAFYILLWFVSPLVADFYQISELKVMLRVLALSLILNALFTVPATLVTIELDFKVFAKVNFIAVLVAGGMAIYFAYHGHGAWSLVYQTIIKAAVTGILLWIWTKWKPIWVFSKTSFKSLFSYGSKLLVSSLMNTSVSNISALLIAKVISARELGYYTQGTQFTDLIFKTVNAMVEKVLLPGLSKIQDQKDVLIKYYKNIIKIVAIFVTPVFFILIVVAEPMIKVLLTEKWLPVVPVMQLFALARLITIICGINVNLLYVLGRTDLALKQQYVKIPIRLVLLLAALKFGIIYVALAELLATTIHYFIDSYFPGKIMAYGAKKQLNDLYKIAGFNFILMIGCYLALMLIPNDIVKLIVGPILYLALYLLGNFYFKVPEFMGPLNKFLKLIPFKK
ncbi:lipopolysaccharide biosynthesis protein [Flagellimonas marina]|uniref:Lipopolysaccharide biosynthesis protein n=1 Tax=Flagellimonas marina TaxID=1775168 RepID=A0ABV8PKJ0_9FLAO